VIPLRNPRLLELIEPAAARLDVPDDAPEFMQVVRCQMGLQALEQLCAKAVVTGRLPTSILRPSQFVPVEEKF